MEDPFATILILFCATPFGKLSISELKLYIIYIPEIRGTLGFYELM